jgi:hypothetical protein
LRILRELIKYAGGANSLTIYLAFVIVRTLPFLLYLANFGVQIAPDSGTYRYGFLNWSVLGNHRGYGVTIPFTLCPNDLIIVVLQFILVTTSGTMLIAVLNKANSNFKYLPIAAVFAVLNSPTIAIWDIWILSHSISIAYNIFSLVFLLKFLKSKAQRHLYAFACFLFLSSISRPNNQAVLIIALICIFLYFLLEFAHHKLNLSKLVEVFLIFVLLMATSLSININLGKKSSPSVAASMLPYLLDATAPISKDLILEARVDPTIPKCVFPPEPLKNGNGEYFEHLRINCPQGMKWLEENFQSWYIEFLATSPRATLKALSYGTSVGLGYPINYGDTFPTVIPEPILKLFIGAPKVGNVKPGIFPFFGWMLMALFIWIQTRLGRRRLGVISAKSGIETVVIVYLAWMASSVISIIYQSHSDAFRVFVDNQVIITIFSVYLFSLNLSLLKEAGRSVI